mmetsp:Transcript_28636/g.33283  ORF Transcript_28636/g.33283 Transcript_28636/m.33283 type:complete len:724 (+) Transcript_28636:24-2195(+)
MMSRWKKWSGSFSATSTTAVCAAIALISIFLSCIDFTVELGSHAFAPYPSLHYTKGLIRADKRLLSSVLKSSGDDEGEEWRAFRARLVQKGLPSLDDKVTVDCISLEHSDSNSRYAHESTPLVEVGTILISIPTTDLCQALEQQYWHRAVVLITEAAKDPRKGDVETVPDEELAQGANRGRFSYRGVLLNRFTDLVFDSETVEQKERNSQGSGWKIQRGGDLLGLDSSNGHTEFICLHHLSPSDPNVRAVSKKLVGDLSCVSFSDAQSLCKKYSSKYSPDDFFIFGGFCSWRPGQLEMEMGEEREEWLALSIDDNSILEELQHQVHESKIVTKFSSNGPNMSRGFLDTGTAMWRNFLALVDVSESSATERLPAGQLDFYDRMLNIWAEDNLILDKNGVDSIVADNDSTDLIGPGTLLRAKSHVSNDIILFEKEIIRCLVLVLEDTCDATVGIMLNHPLAAAVECIEGKPPLPLRYGGPIDVPTWKDGRFCEDFDGEDDEEEDEMYEGFGDFQNGVAPDYHFLFDDSSRGDIDYDDNGRDEEEDESPFIWIHRDAALGSRGPDGGGGSQLGTSGVWLIKENDALKSLQSGFLCLEDTMVFSGVCIWEKGPDLGVCGGGLREQVDALESLEVVQACNDQNDNDAIESIWDILSKRQNVLVKETFESNVDAAIDAWESCTDRMDLPVGQSSSKVGLSDAALRAWLSVNLLGDPLGTFIEVKNRAKQ